LNSTLPSLPETGAQLSLPLTETEARELTDQIKALADQVWALLLEAHERKAWKVLGYISWEAYVRTEFDMNRRRSYQVLDQGRVIRELSSIPEVRTDVHISEAVARDIKPILPQVTERIREAVQNVPAEKVAEIVQEVIDKERGRIVAFKEGREACKALAEELNLQPTTQEEKDRVQVMYGLYEALKEIEAMPPATKAAAMVKDYEKRDLETLPRVIEWLSEFAGQVGVGR